MDNERAETYRRQMTTVADPPSASVPATRLAEALRHLQRALAGTRAADGTLDEMAAVVEELAARLAPDAEDSRYPQGERLGGPSGHFLTHPIVGPTNPIAPPIAIRPEGDTMVGRVVYGSPYEGPPGYLHGGHIAAAFDVMLATTAGINGVGGLTKTLSVRYRRPVPLHRDLLYRGRLDVVEERQAVIKGTQHHGDELCAEAMGEFAYRAGRPPTPT
jgi:acyl-coenzyme A thioesterase PaaI-like protein